MAASAVSARIVRIDNEVIRFLVEMEASSARRARLRALMARTDCAGEIRAFAQDLGFAFTLREFLDALDHLNANPDRATSGARPFRLARSVAGVRACCEGCGHAGPRAGGHR